MNLTPTNWKKSEVTENKEFVKVGMTLFFTDPCQCERFEVMAVNEKSMTVRDATGEEFEKDFDGLQIGWSFTSKDLEFIELIKDSVVASLCNCGGDDFHTYWCKSRTEKGAK